MTVAIADNEAQQANTADIARASTGDRQAFERLYHGHVNRVFALCVRMTGDRGVAEELTQDVFVRAWQKLSLYRGESAFGTWLHRLAVNVVLNERKVEGRKRSRFDDDATDVDVLPQAGGGPVDVTGLSIDLDAAIAGLPPGARRIFVLHDVEGYKHEEIAEMLDITSGGSKAQLHRARLLLREALQR